MANFSWPGNLDPIAFGFYFVDADTSGGATLGGGEQYVLSPGPRWGASMTLPIVDLDDVYSIRALRSQLMGRANGIVLQCLDRQRAPWPVSPAGELMTATAWARRKQIEAEHQALELERAALPPQRSMRNLDRHKWKQFEEHARRIEAGELGEIDPAAIGDPIAASIEVAALIRATQIKINIDPSIGVSTLKGGMQFSITGASRMYEIATIVSHSSDIWTVNIQPPLRAAAAVGAIVNFTTPVQLMRCLNMNEELRKLDLLRFATLNLEFIELL